MGVPTDKTPVERASDFRELMDLAKAALEEDNDGISIPAEVVDKTFKVAVDVAKERIFYDTVNMDNVVDDMRVKLVFPDNNYDLDESNPVVGGPHECSGFVDWFDEDENAIYVEWDNGQSNAYKNGELVKDDEPPKYDSIW